MNLLFASRMVLYLAAFLLPVIHPAVSVRYDAVGWCIWFFLVPAQMLTAYLGAPPRLKPLRWLVVAASVLVAAEAFIIFKTGLSEMALLGLGVGLASFVITALIFRAGERFAAVAVLEQFFLAWLYYRMLNFSRASEEIASSATGLAQIILVGAVVALLAHGVILYLALYRGGKRGAKEAALFAGIALPVLLLVILALPPDFVKNSQIANILGPEPDPELVPLDGWSRGQPGGPLRGNEGDQGQNDGDGQEGDRGPLLEGIPSDQWQEGMGGQGGRQGQNGQEGEGSTGQGRNQGQGEGEGDGEGGEERQYTVMVVASPVSPVYAATEYRGDLDPVQGFGATRDEPLNDLTYLRLLETWVDPDPPLDAAREEVPIYTLSTISERTLAYRPWRVEPTVLDRQYHPLDFSFNAVSALSVAGPDEYLDVPELDDGTRAKLASYLESDLDPATRAAFQSFLDAAVQGLPDAYFARIYGILRSFSAFQYNIGYEEDVSVGKMLEFLTTLREGDCTEFSNTAGILARLAGIPSRVVVGYLASKDLQLDAHKQGLFVLQQMVEPLKKYDIEDLYLVTNAHRHSWVQFYMPGYGWVDFDPTSYGIPPVGSGDANQRNVVIPIIDPQPNPREFRPFPWLALLKGLGIALGATVVGLYLFRYIREAVLAALARRNDARGLRAAERLLLMRLAADGYVIKQPWETPLEFSRRLPETREFATLYTELRWSGPDGGNDRPWSGLRRSYRDTLRRLRRRGLVSAARRVVSLRSLHY